MASGQGNVEEALAALLALKPVIHDGVGNETTLTYGITSQTRAVPALPGSAELDRMRQSLEIMKHNVSETVRQLQLNMDTIGAFLRAQNALLPAQPPLPQRQGSQDGILKIKLVNHQAGDKKGPTPSNRPTPPPVDANRRKRGYSEMLAESAPADAIYSMRVENTAVHITPDNKMKVVIYPRVGATGDTAKQKNKNKAGPPPLTGTPMPRRPETQIPAHLLDDLYSNAHPTVMGVPLDGDFTKLPKPQNQLPVEQFWRHAEQFWRPLTEEDFAWLQSPGEQVQVYALPSLGRPYAQQWDDEDRVLAGNDPLTARSVETSEFRFENDIIVPGDAMLGPFTERTLQALVQEDLLDTTSVVSQTSDAETLVQQPIPEYLPRTKQDLADLEERIRVELQYIDLAPPSDLPGGDSQDDEVTRELRRAQHQIKSQIERNTRIKARIHEVALKWLAYQEYVGVKEELDRQIDAAYVRRFRTIKKKKKSGERPQTSYVRPIGGDNSGSLIAKRRAWIDKAGSAFDMTKVERTPIFQNLDE